MANHRDIDALSNHAGIRRAGVVIITGDDGMLAVSITAKIISTGIVIIAA